MFVYFQETIPKYREKLGIAKEETILVIVDVMFHNSLTSTKCFLGKSIHWKKGELW